MMRGKKRKVLWFYFNRLHRTCLCRSLKRQKLDKSIDRIIFLLAYCRKNWKDKWNREFESPMSPFQQQTKINIASQSDLLNTLDRNIMENKYFLSKKTFFFSLWMLKLICIQFILCWYWKWYERFKYEWRDKKRETKMKHKKMNDNNITIVNKTYLSFNPPWIYS